MTDRRYEPRPKTGLQPDGGGRTPAEQVLLALGRAKRAGEAFEPAWRKALAAVVWPAARVEETAWRYGLRSTRESWQSAYEDAGDAIGEAVARAA